MPKLRMGFRSRCGVCTLDTANYVPPEGPVPCEVMFIGEAPGENEVRLKRPFVGNSGQILNGMLKAAGFKRKEVYITNSCMCRPPNNRKPTSDEIHLCNMRLYGEIKKVKPKVMVMLGHTAYEATFGIKGPALARSHGSTTPILYAPKLEVIALFTYHPQATCYSAYAKVYLKDDLIKARKILDGEIAP